MENQKLLQVFTLLVKTKIVPNKFWVKSAILCKASKDFVDLKFEDIVRDFGDLEAMICYDCGNIDESVDDYPLSSRYNWVKQLCKTCSTRVKKCEWCGLYNYCIVKSGFRGRYNTGGMFVANVCLDIDDDTCNTRGLKNPNNIAKIKQ
jgi:hypothetical protein